MLKRRYLLLLLLLSSCEEIVNPDLITADPVVVIDAIVSNTESKNYVILSKTSAFNAQGSTPKISGANVTLTYSNETVNYTESDSGKYIPNQDISTSLLSGQYRLEMEVENNLYAAEGILPTFILLDSITVSRREEDPSFDDGYYPIIHFTDPPNEINYYMWEIYLNSEFISSDDIILNDDEAFEGRSVAYELPFSIALEDVNVGDTLKVYNYSISSDAYDYYNGLLLLVGSGSPAQAIPDNPVSNIEGGGLGFFNVCQIDSTFVLIED
ncbi:MAG: hypothetical protein CMO01_07120 [Thalassobius sp.]|nr:hypothetical protein [Thalassovita sp.]